MLSNQKYRVTNLSKDFDIKSKDIVDTLARYGVVGKTYMATVEPRDFNIMLAVLTENCQIDNIDAYMNGEVWIEGFKQEEKKPIPQPPKAEKKAEEVKAARAKVEEQKKAEPTQKPAAAPQPAKAPESKPQQQAHPQGQPAQPKGQQPQTQQAQGQQAKNPQKPQQAQSQQNQQNKQKQNKPQAQQRQFRQEIKVQPVYDPKQEKNRVSQSAHMGGTRVVDTRTSHVDLSKYDERLEKFVPEANNDKNKYGSERQRLKKQDRNKDREKEKLAMERLKKQELEKAKKLPVAVQIPDEIAVGELASRLKVTASEVIKKLMMMGMMVNVNQVIDYETAYIVADEFGARISKEVVVTIEDKLFEEEKSDEANMTVRAPVVVVMGHVDHGKTSLLGAIRHSNVTAGEAGGITQHIGAYRVNINGKDLTFLDTPGHEAFTAMRARGAKATDIAILVVAADDGIMPQTVEAINHAKAANLDIIVAINKMDKPGANPEGIKQELTQYELVPEEWGGDTICVPVSALTKMGLDDLLENVLLVAEMRDLKADPSRRAKGVVIEAKLDKGRGPVATVLVQNGTLKSGDVVIAGTAVGHVRVMLDDKGKTIKTAGPSVPVEIVGLSEVPAVGDEFNAVEDERMARTLAEQRRAKAKEESFNAGGKVSLDDLFAQISEGTQELNVIVKADVGGTAEAVKSSLEKLSTNEIKVKVIHTAVGGITENDVMLASASNAIIIGFHVRPDKKAIDSAERNKVDVRTYNIIYECIAEVTAAMQGMLAPEYKEVILGHAEVRKAIHVPNVGTIAGSYVQDGKITRNALIRVLRDGIIIFEDKISSLRRFKDDVKEVAQGYECGIGLERFNDVKDGDMFEAYEMAEVARKL